MSEFLGFLFMLGLVLWAVVILIALFPGTFLLLLILAGTAALVLYVPVIGFPLAAMELVALALFLILAVVFLVAKGFQRFKSLILAVVHLVAKGFQRFKSLPPSNPAPNPMMEGPPKRALRDNRTGRFKKAGPEAL